MTDYPLCQHREAQYLGGYIQCNAPVRDGVCTRGHVKEQK